MSRLSGQTRPELARELLALADRPRDVVPTPDGGFRVPQVVADQWVRLHTVDSGGGEEAEGSLPEGHEQPAPPDPEPGETPSSKVETAPSSGENASPEVDEQPTAPDPEPESPPKPRRGRPRKTQPQ